ncbi:hypothetical protein HWB07_gp121 [Bacillus phage vB_BsuM-Goe3]|uniref:Uncharacterized protein n=1 Tax=Bacillus phage vB_BsuM-Goe3 TaxID=1933063 RepID=A0A217ERC0_BPGO3|nr:hypothetical protein HWB07_gp121 [Bacillus phage vB_BsuM-Goe3]APZ82649.1 hypothetical protein Goe3_c18800 [Bacillus phage vB_BsuM-Goe3]
MKFLRRHFDTILYICGAAALFLNGMVFKGPTEHVLIGILLVFMLRFGFILGDYYSSKNRDKGRG